MSTNIPDDSNKLSTPVPTSLEDVERSAEIARHVLKPAINATAVTYVSLLGIMAAIHYNRKEMNVEFWITILIGYSGAIFGWLAGFMASPYDAREEKRLTRVASWIWLLFSGYLIGKLEPSITQLINDGSFIKVPLYGVRLLNFLGIFISTGITVYQYRLWGVGSPAVKTDTSTENRAS